MFVESLNLLIKIIKSFDAIVKLGIEEWIKLISFIIAYWHACVEYPFWASHPKEKAIYLNNMFIAH